jgi:hypothetical protein
VIPGARCWIGTAITGDADQREIRNQRYRYLAGLKYRWPLLFNSAGDWTGPWMLTQLDNAAKTLPWASTWPKLKAQIASWPTLPPLRNAMTITRFAGGFLAALETSDGLAHPALWAQVQIGVETYGCVPSWGKAQVVPVTAYPPPRVGAGLRSLNAGPRSRRASEPSRERNLLPSRSSPGQASVSASGISLCLRDDEAATSTARHGGRVLIHAEDFHAIASCTSGLQKQHSCGADLRLRRSDSALHLASSSRLPVDHQDGEAVRAGRVVSGENGVNAAHGDLEGWHQSSRTAV